MSFQLTFSVTPVADLPARAFKIETDPYGATITDIESGLSVTLDWNGSEVKAIITAEGQDDPSVIHTFKPKG